MQWEYRTCIAVFLVILSAIWDFGITWLPKKKIHIQFDITWSKHWLCIRRGLLTWRCLCLGEWISLRSSSITERTELGNVGSYIMMALLQPQVRPCSWLWLLVVHVSWPDMTLDKTQTDRQAWWVASRFTVAMIFTLLTSIFFFTRMDWSRLTTGTNEECYSRVMMMMMLRRMT